MTKSRVSPDALVAWSAIAALGTTFIAKAAGHPISSNAALVLWLALPLGGAAILARADAPAMLGLTRFDLRGVGVAFGGSLMMLTGLAAGSEAGPHLDVGALWDGAFRPGIVEELLFRGLAFGALFSAYWTQWNRLIRDSSPR